VTIFRISPGALATFWRVPKGTLFSRNFDDGTAAILFSRNLDDGKAASEKYDSDRASKWPPFVGNLQMNLAAVWPD
jgi:hypothetical protein